MAMKAERSDDRAEHSVLGVGTLADLIEDAVAYRLLEPVDPRLPGLGALRGPLGLAADRIPRKTEPSYARVVCEILRAALGVVADDVPIDAVVLIGDTEHNDGTAFANLCDALDVPGAAFICHERDAPPATKVRDLGRGRSLVLANRWSLLDSFEGELGRQGLAIGRGTAVILDIDKTALGARGRNHLPIDAARGAAVLRTARGIRGDVVDGDRLLAAYDHFNHPRFHPFTTDNQDYLAYLAMLVEAGWSPIREIEAGIVSGRFPTFGDLLAAVTDTLDAGDEALRRAHSRVVDAVAANDPTPFKDFRRAEFRETADRMTPVDGGDDVAALLESRIVLTGEIWLRARQWRDRGALLFGLSDKPDEASSPDPELAAGGYRPLHRTEAMIVGEA